MGLAQPVAVRALEGCRNWLRYEDGGEGEVDLSHMLDRELFQNWKDRAVFESVHIDGRDVSWGEETGILPGRPLNGNQWQDLRRDAPKSTPKMPRWSSAP